MLVEPGVYLIGPGDILSIQVGGEDDLTGDYEVQASGTIRFPLLDEVRVAGLKPGEAASRLEKLLEKDYFVDVQMNLTVKEFRSQWVNVLGEVKKPGKYYLKTYTTLMDIISEAGGLGENVSDTIIVQREVEEQGIKVIKTYPVPVNEIIAGTGLLPNMPLFSGDTIYIQESQFFFVTGEVTRPGKYQLSEDMTVMEAIAVAGDFGKFANRKNVEIHRKKADGTTDVIEINLPDIRKNKAENIRLEPGDLIVINRRFL